MLSISNTLFTSLFRQLEGVSEESCGFLLGICSYEGAAEVLHTIQVANIEERDRRKFYLINPTDFRRVESMAETMNLEIIGVFHTHLDQAPVLSNADKRYAFPGFFYLIFSMIDLKYSNARCWRLNDEMIFQEIGINITNS